MFKKIIAGVLLVATMSFGMSLSKLNSASKAELMEINGIGEVKATEIIKQRRKGKFKSFTDLQERVEGIGEQTAANIKGGVKNAEDVKKVKKITKNKMKKKADAKAKNLKSKAPKKKRKIKKIDEKKQELKKKTRKTKKLKTKNLKKKLEEQN